MRNWYLMTVFFFLVISIYAQESNNINDLQLTRERTTKLLEYSDFYAQPKDSLWFVGKEYKFLNTNSNGSPYFFDEMKFKGSLVFNGIKYKNLDLIYDLVKDDLILHHASSDLGFTFINLNKAWIEEFTLERNGSEFKFLPDSYFKGLKNKIPEGFLEVIYDNNLKLLFKNSKKMTFESFDNNFYKYAFKLSIYLIRDNQAFDVTKRSDFFSAFEGRKKQIRDYMNDSKIMYKNATKTELISLMKYCETLL